MRRKYHPPNIRPRSAKSLNIAREDNTLPILLHINSARSDTFQAERLARCKRHRPLGADLDRLGLTPSATRLWGGAGPEDGCYLAAGMLAF